MNLTPLLAILIVSSVLVIQQAGQHQTLAATPPANIRLANSPYAQNEPSIAVNPRNPSNLIASSRDFSLGYRQCRYYYSSDGGQTWGKNLIPMTGPLSPFFWCSDASVAFDGYGNAYYAALVLYPGDNRTYRGAVFVARSTNGGMNYDTPALVRNVTGLKDRVELDKDYIAVDQKLNHVYVTWTELPFFNNSAWVDFSSSFNNATTFSPHLRVTDIVNNATWSTLAQPAVGPNGEVYVEWVRGFNPDNNTYTLVFARSLDFGTHFAANVDITTFQAIPGSLNPYTFRATSIPSIDADRSNGTFRGAVYITWADERNRDADIFEVHSYNKGVAWSQPTRVNDDPLHDSRDQWMPWVNVSPDGKVNIVFDDRRDDPSNTLFNLYWTYSLDGGVTFQPNYKITTVQSTPAIWPQPVNADYIGPLGDYIGMTSQTVGNSTYLYPIWTDSRDGSPGDQNLNIYTAIIGPPTGPSNFNVFSGELDILLSWSYPSSSNGPPITGYKIYRSTVGGGESYLQTVGNVTSYDDRSVIIGTTYYYRVSALNSLGEGPLTSEASGSASGGLPATAPVFPALLIPAIALIMLSQRKRSNHQSREE